jgi:DNA replication protein DnaC
LWLAQHSGLQYDEQHTMLADYRTIGPPEYMGQRLKAKAALQEAIQKQHGLYTFYGDFGSGKTLALQVVVNELRQQMVEGYYAPFADIIDHLFKLLEAGKGKSAYWERLLEIPVLALDEVSRFNENSPWVKERLFVLANTRYRLRSTHLTLFATNANPKAALPPDDAIGYLFSRMREGKKMFELRGDVRSVVEQGDG